LRAARQRNGLTTECGACAMKIDCCVHEHSPFLIFEEGFKLADKTDACIE
jgi:hypothetical protein